MSKVDKIKLYGVYSEENKILKEEWFLSTLKDDFEIHLKYLGKIGEGQLNCKEPAWYLALREKSKFIFQAIQDNMGNVIISSDVDIQFFRKSIDIIKKYIRNKDVVFQAEHRPFDGQVNTGFIAIKCNERTLQLWKYILNMEIEKMPFGDQSAINHIIKNELVQCKWGVFPNSIWAYSQGIPPPINIVLHHANAAKRKEGQGSLDAKIDQLKMVRKEALMKERLT